MRKILFLPILFLCGVSFSQGTYTPTTPTIFGSNNNRGNFDSTLHIPTGCGTPTDSSFLHDKVIKNKAAKYFDSCGHGMYGNDGSYG